MTRSNTKIAIRDLTFAYNGRVVLDNVSVDFPTEQITAITGPSGQGKSTLLTAINRLADEIPGAQVTGDIEIRLDSGSVHVYKSKYYIPDLRRKVGLVFQKPNPLPSSIISNVSLPLRLAGLASKDEIAGRCEEAMRMASIWDEVKNRLGQSALELSGGQQQRLCIARALVLKPEVLMLDEPTSSLDPAAAGQIEELLVELRNHCTILVVSHYLEQVNRIANTTYTIKDGKILLQG